MRRRTGRCAFATLAATARDQRLQGLLRRRAPAADATLSSVPMAALDIETTGLDPSRHEIVSIALVPMTLAQIEGSRTRHWIVKPRGDLAAESVAFHGITHSQVAISARPRRRCCRRCWRQWPAA